jgi:SpoIID/LytB domain protein
MGQYGALGYALNFSWSASHILNHFYSNTTAGSVAPGSPISVRMTNRDGKSTIVTQEKGHMTTSLDGTPRSAVRVDRVGANTFQVYFGSGCGGPWTARPGTVTGPVRMLPQVVNNDRTEMLQLCEDAGPRWLRGEIKAVEGDGSIRTVNVVALDDYLRGVVPRESPASWATLGGGKGMQALMAQSVAARSYAWAQNRYAYAKTCDTTTCQVYGGRAVQTASGFTDLEDSRTDTAIANTAGSVRLLNGAVASTEFSSSTGGYTAGGTFPAVIDEGDAITSPNNPNHTWTTQIPISSIESRYGKGTFASATVTARNGLGEDGGRVVNMRLTFSGGSVDVSGNAFRAAFGLKSDWFTPLNGRPPGPPGYHILNRAGGIYTFGNAKYFGNLIDRGYPGPGIGLADTPDGKGYAILNTGGGLYTFGNAKYYGNLIDRGYPGPAVAISMTPSGQGYAILNSGGGLYTFGDAKYFGNLIDKGYPGRAVSLSYTPSGKGYVILTDAGALYTFGDAAYRGNLIDHGFPGPAVSVAHTRAGGGYYILTQSGALYSFDYAPYFGNLLDNGFPGPAVALSTTP